MVSVGADSSPLCSGAGSHANAASSPEQVRRKCLCRIVDTGSSYVTPGGGDAVEQDDGGVYLNHGCLLRLAVVRRKGGGVAVTALL